MASDGVQDVEIQRCGVAGTTTFLGGDGQQVRIDIFVEDRRVPLDVNRHVRVLPVLRRGRGNDRLAQLDVPEPGEAVFLHGESLHGLRRVVDLVVEKTVLAVLHQLLRRLAARWKGIDLALVVDEQEGLHAAVGRRLRVPARHQRQQRGEPGGGGGQGLLAVDLAGERLDPEDLVPSGRRHHQQQLGDGRGAGGQQPHRRAAIRHRVASLAGGA
mmetsp:Transcript_32319/g.106679  ORF Transcript_32319/g.106679 Transcript_32319/m.106679 type:complete len:214 (-) Transcript_32319:1664-2305(-)